LIQVAGTRAKGPGSLDETSKLSSSQSGLSDEELMLEKYQEVLPSCFQVGLDPDCTSWWNPFPQGWWPDVWYYSANNHPLHGIFMCDPIHPLSWIERVCMELATLGFTCWTAVLQYRWVTEDPDASRSPFPFLQNPLIFSLVMVTIPGMIMWWTLFLLFTCKCGQVNKARTSRKATNKAKILRGVGATIAYILCTVGVLCLLYFFFAHLATDMKSVDITYWLPIVVKARVTSSFGA